MRLIDADDAERAIAEQMAYEARMEYGGRQKAEDYLLIARSYFQNCPTIEAEPVRRGRWKKRARGAELVCSECNGLISMIRVDYTWQPHITTTTLPHNYCPNCGAQMEEQE